MAEEVRMPQLSDTMETGTIVKWLVEEGDEVSMGDVMAEVETDKATMDLESFEEGVLLKKMISEGEKAPTQAIIAIIGEEGEDISELITKAEASLGESSDQEEEKEGEEEESEEKSDESDDEPEESEEESDDKSEESEEESDDDPEESDEEPESEPERKKPEPVSEPSGDSHGQLRVSPVARRIAADNRIDLFALSGSGPEGRIVKRDVEKAIKEGTARVGQSVLGKISKSSPLKAEKRKLSGMRKTIAERMTKAKQDAPHFYLETRVDMERVADLREDLQDTLNEGDSFSYNDFILLASSRALCEVPEVNSSYKGEHLQIHGQVNLAFAVAVEDGLYTPVIENAEKKSIIQLHEESQKLIERTRSGKLTPDEYTSGTFTISNLGMFGITNFSAVINPPQSAILAVGAVREEPVAHRGRVEIRRQMDVTLSCDHRAMDGVHGARFLKELRNLLEHPIRLLS